MTQPFPHPYPQYPHPHGYQPAPAQAPVPIQGGGQFQVSAPAVVGFASPLGGFGVQLGAFLDTVSGEIESMMADAGMDSTGAVPQGRVLRIDPNRLAQLTQRLRAADEGVRNTVPQAAPIFAPIHRTLNNAVKLASGAQQAAQAAAIGERVRQTAARLKRPIAATPICIDALAATTATGVIEVGAPYNGQPWQFVALHASGAGASSTATNQLRLTEYNMAGVNAVSVANVTGISPTSPGWDLSLFSPTNMLAAVRSEYFLAPWTDRPDLVLDSSAKLRINVYNPHTAAQSANITVLTITSPCNESFKVGEGGLLNLNSARSFVKSAAAGQIGKLLDRLAA